ncbi:MAG: hypothetical protein LBD47_09050 [Treponema sp.]|jgi:hypothetical protein|nr:hypothetical protein [Treponema sp.]
MTNSVREKLKIIKDIYPDEKLKTRKERWRRMWRGEPPLDRYPFVFYPPLVDYYNTVYPKEERFNLFLDEFILRGNLEEDYIPAFFPGCRQGTIPGMFGAKEIVACGDYTCEKIIFNPEDINKLPEPSIKQGTPAYDMLEMERYFIEESDGQIPVHVCDMQGPLDAAAQLWGYDPLFLSAYDDDGKYDGIMDLVTRAFIMLWDAQKKICGDRFIATHMYGWTWVPDGLIGASLSADSMAMMSPDYFNEYYKPYIEKLGEYFGALTIHSCGNFSTLVKCLAEMPEIKAVNASQMTPQALYEAGWNPSKIIITKEDFDKAPAIFSFIREKKLRVEFCIRELWETGEKGLAKNPAAWTGETWDRIKARNLQVSQWANFSNRGM